MRESLTNRHIGMGKGFDKPPSRAPNLTTIMSTNSPSNDVSRLQEDIDVGSIDDGSADRLSERSTFDVNTTGDKKLQSMDDVASSSSDSAVEFPSDVVPYNFGEEVAGDEGSKSSYNNNGNSKNFLKAVILAILLILLALLIENHWLKRMKFSISAMSKRKTLRFGSWS